MKMRIGPLISVEVDSELVSRCMELRDYCNLNNVPEDAIICGIAINAKALTLSVQIDIKQRIVDSINSIP